MNVLGKASSTDIQCRTSIPRSYRHLCLNSFLFQIKIKTSSKLTDISRNIVKI